jgi:hypothetical protein
MLPIGSLFLALGCGKEKSPDPGPIVCKDYEPLKNVYFGDLHVHTSYSFDAYDYGTRTDPSTAYGFARGTSVDVAPGADPARGQTPGPLGVKINFSGRKLDFMGVTDHAEFLGSQHGCTVDPKSGFYDNPYCASLRTAINDDFESTTSPSYVLKSPCLGKLPNTKGAETCADQTRLAWEAEQQATRTAYEPCAFTTLHGFEWSGVVLETTPNATLHRNVFFGTDNVPALPIDFVEHRKETGLWQALEEQCTEATGCSAITIPHNSNRSQGFMFDVSAYTADDMRRAVQYQKLVEIHQHKGNSECLTDTADNGAVTPCNFELENEDLDPSFAPGYVRPALERGLALQADKGSNPMQLGFVGATDTHNATPGRVAESEWVGHTGVEDNTPLLRLRGLAGQNPGGITGVWAEQNTRDRIWAAFQRREVFATSGPRIVVRFYAYANVADPCKDPKFPSALVAAGAVPMGGTMPKSSAPPSFVVYALADENPLQGVDLVKGSYVGGQTVERVYAVPLSSAPYCITWTDPDFKQDSVSFYYARVKEAPTPRWSHYDCDRLKQTNPSDWSTLAPGCQSTAADGLDRTIQERAWTSPIWYLPM